MSVRETMKLRQELDQMGPKLDMYASGRFSGPPPTLDTCYSYWDRIIPHFDINKINGATPRESILAANLAASSMIPLGTLVRVAAKYKYTELAVQVANAWPSVWAWAKFFISAAEEDLINAQAVENFFLAGNMIYSICQEERVFAAVEATTDMAEIVAQSWQCEDRFETQGTFEQYAALLAVLLEKEGFCKKLAQEMNGPRNLAKNALRRMRRAMEHTRFNIKNLYSYLIMLRDILQSGEHDIRIALLQAGLLPAVIKSLTLLNDVSTAEASRNSVFACYTVVFSACRKVNNGNRWAAQALRHGVIPAFLGSAKFLAHLDMDEEAKYWSYNLLSHTFIPWLVHRSVIHAAEEQLRLYGNVQVAGILRAPWDSFRRVVWERVEAMNGFEAVHLKCQSCGVAVNVRKRCGGCQGPRYCSRECQRRHWHEHRVECLTHRALFSSREDLRGRVTRAEFQLLIPIAWAELVIDQMPNMDARLAQEFPGVPSKDLVFGLDLTKVPTKFFLRRREPCSELDYRPASDEDIIVLQIVALSHDSTLIDMQHPMPKPPGLER